MHREVKVKFVKGEDMSFKVYPITDVTMLRSVARKEKKEPAKQPKKIEKK